MEPTVKLRLGDLFDGPSDLIVLPCSTSGTVTGFVAQSLSHYAIPHPSEGMKLGEVEILPFEGADNVAQYVAFAASVHGDYSRIYSTAKAIENIRVALGNFTKTESSVRTIFAPLLGAGVGGLQSEVAVAALKRGFDSTADSGATLVIRVPDCDAYERLKCIRSAIRGDTKGAIRVFVSHTSKTDVAITWVKSLARFLIEHGIQARLDKFHLRRGMDLPQWMCNELVMAQKVIVVCDEEYKMRADGRLGGVGWETMLIQGDIVNLPPESTKYQVVVRSDDLQKGLPIYLRTRYAFHASTSVREEAFRVDLLRELLDLPIDPILESKEFPI